MRLPPSLLTTRATIRHKSGDGAEGPLFKDTENVRCRMEVSRKLRTDRNGQQYMTSFAMYVLPAVGERTMPADRVVYNGEEYEVVEVDQEIGHRRPTHFKLVLK